MPDADVEHQQPAVVTLLVEEVPAPTRTPRRQSHGLSSRARVAHRRVVVDYESPWFFLDHAHFRRHRRHTGRVK